MVDRYLLEDRLGRGGMGCVWRARDLVLGRQVAIKLTDRAGAARGSAERRLRREATVIGNLTERRLARVYDYFETADGSFIVMELVQGESLSARIKREGRLPLAEAVWIVAECAEALHAAHRAGVVHRDVKPSNIMLTASKDATSKGAAQDIKIVDFGIAARTRPAPNRDPHAQEPLELETETMTGNIVGTIAYLAPERVSGAPDSPAADLYSLGVLFYQLLSGRLPFEASEPIAVLCAHADGRAAPLPADIPPPVAEQCFRLMARDPADRPPSGAAAAAELRALDVEHPERLWPQPRPVAERGKALISVLRTGPGRQRAGRQRIGRQAKAMVAAGCFAAMATAGCTAWLVAGFGTQAAAGSAQQTTSRPASTSPSSPGPVHAVSAVVSPSQSAGGNATTPAARSGPAGPAPSTSPKPGGDKGGDNGGSSHGKHKGH
ncbi:MAG TPA: serine/threonine-protein kinase [Actinocrinis sp.]|nr:serine/threonine-protein kinase [Actinocrinis sp.]